VKPGWEPESLDDRKSILEFISADRPQAAIDVDDFIVEGANSLKRFPEKGRISRNPGTREIVIHNTRYIAAYRIEGDTIVVIRVVDGARRWPRMRKRPRT
jgi:addiction module RelE/StbE family toxin